MGKEKKNMEKDMENKKDNPTVVGVTLSFLHTTKVKENSSLQGDSMMYNELMTLKNRIGKMKQDQDTNRAKILQLEVHVGNIPEKLKEYEHELYLLIKESGNKMEQVTSSLCVAAASLDKKNNEEIMSPSRPRKRTRLSSRKKATKATGGSRFSTTDLINNTIEVGKEVVKMIKELQ